MKILQQFLGLATSVWLVKSATTSCSTPSGTGFCESTSSSCSGGSFYAGYCPGASNIQCCVASCSASSGSGICEPTSNSCAGGYVSGLCPGPSDVECCVGSSGTTPTGVKGLDISSAPSSSFWSCAASQYSVIVIRGYQQACGSGGQVDSNFVSSYKAAVAAGFSRIDSYMFPCTGTPSSGEPNCKSPSTQLAEYLAVIKNNGMNLHTLWFDIEPTSTASGDACNAWNLGSSSNLALAQQWVSLLESSGYNWGIYANGNQWSGMFPSRSTDIASSLPLWGVQDNMVPGVNTLTTFMGGWTKGNAKQYDLDTTVCGQGVDISSFLN